MSVTSETQTMHCALVGNPNVGKTTLFNRLTGLAQHVANFPGVTVEQARGRMIALGRAFVLTDLPGSYSLVAHSADEAVVARSLCGGEEEQGRRPDLAVVVVDAGNLARNLFLVSEVLDCGLPVVVAVNMMDEAERGGLQLDAKALEQALGVVCVPVVARDGRGLDELQQAIVRASTNASIPARAWNLPGSDEAKLSQAVADGSSCWAALTALRTQDPTLRTREIEARHKWAQEVSAQACQGLASTRGRKRSDRLDAVLLHPVMGPLLFVAIMGLLFQSVFTWAIPLMDLIEQAVGSAQGLVGGPGLVRQFLSDGVVAGVGNVVIFLPQILILFLGLGLLEDSGYLTRAAFIVDRPFKALGLSGKSFLPLLSSYACAVPGIMAARTIRGSRERLATILIAPLIPCSARLPVYALLIAAFIPATTLLGFNLQGLVMLGLYVLGTVAAGLVALLIHRWRAREGELPMMLELPPYRVPTVRSVALRLKQRAGAFLKSAGTLILLASIVLWALAMFPRADPPAGMTGEEVAQHQLAHSAAGWIGHTLEPLVRPLGFDWKITIGLVGSIAAREVFVGTMGVVYAVGHDVDETNPSLREAMRSERHASSGLQVYSLPTVCGLLVFYVFALQCVSTLAVAYRETRDWRVPVAQFVVYTAMAWVGAYATRLAVAAFV